MWYRLVCSANQWQTNIDTQTASTPIFVPCAVRALTQHHSVRGPVALSWCCLRNHQSMDLSEIVEENITPRLELVTSITMYHLSYCISN